MSVAMNTAGDGSGRLTDHPVAPLVAPPVASLVASRVASPAQTAVALPVSDAVEVLNPHRAGPVVILCEHASNHIPARYAGLGLSATDAASHAAWDPGAIEVASLLSDALDAPVIAGKISRLVYDCNRPPSEASAMPATSELIVVPGNQTLTATDRLERETSVYRPFCAAVDAVLRGRAAQKLPTVLLTVHSFTPVYFGLTRAVEIGILHDQDSRMADAMLARAHLLGHRRIERNAPYGPQDGVTHSLRVHGKRYGLPSVMIEVRSDLLQDPAAVSAITAELMTMIKPALQDLRDVKTGATNA